MSARPASGEPERHASAALRLVGGRSTDQHDFQRRRRTLLRRLADPRQRNAAARELDQAYLEHRLEAFPADVCEPVEQLRRRIAASLEGGLLRQSRRAEILAEARRLGIAEFHAHLLIAQVQVGSLDGGLCAEDLVRVGSPPVAARSAGSRVGLRLMAAGLLGAAMFLAMVRYLSL